MSAILGHNSESIAFQRVDLIPSSRNRTIFESQQQVDAFSLTKPDVTVVAKQSAKTAAIEGDDEKSKNIDIFKGERKFPCTVCIL
jgi:hypothetical protein